MCVFAFSMFVLKASKTVLYSVKMANKSVLNFWYFPILNKALSKLSPQMDFLVELMYL